jgi:hypothetical protein
LVFLGIHCDEWDGALKVARDESIEYPLTNDVDGKTQVAYGVEGYPTIIVVDKKGVVRHIDPPNLDEAVKELLKE